MRLKIFFSTSAFLLLFLPTFLNPVESVGFSAPDDQFAANPAPGDTGVPNDTPPEPFNNDAPFDSDAIGNDGSGSGGNPLGLPSDGEELANRVLQIGIGVGGGIAFLLMVFGAYRLIFSGGNPESVQEGRAVITAAISGLLLIIFSVFILNLVGVEILGL